MTDHSDQIVRYGELIPCKTAFIDAHTPGSDQKENFTIIGGGVSESPDQHVHIGIPHGFNIGAAGQPPRVRNSLHSHHTAEVFFVLSGRWRFFWGRWGTAGEVTLEAGDIFNIPTGIFRGFENIGDDYGMIMAILGGDDAGGGVIWAPQVIEDAADHGLVLAETGKLYDTKKGETLPDGVNPMTKLTEDGAAMLLHPGCRLAQGIDHLGVGELDVVGVGGGVNCRGFGDDQAAAARRSCFVIVGEGRGRHAAGDHARHVTGGEDSVLDLQGAKGDGTEQGGKGCGHGRLVCVSKPRA